MDESARIRLLKPEVGPAGRTAPISACPSDEPGLWAEPWRPPASLLRDSSIEDITTLPSCDMTSRSRLAFCNESTAPCWTVMTEGRSGIMITR
jgi:hypothetical protein